MKKMMVRIKVLAIFLLCAATAVASHAQTYTVLHSFDGSDGAAPTAGLIQATDGNFYGTTYSGGAYVYYGTVFKITPDGTFRTLYSFCAHNGCVDGENPVAGLIQGTDGNFYGTTYQGGRYLCQGYPCGTVFKITPNGTLTTLHSFDGADGQFIYAGLVEGTDGNFYGTAFEGGASGFGTVFKITPSGVLTTLHDFCTDNICADGSDPESALIQASDGNLYGTTAYGGGFGKSGTVFKITPDGTLTTVYAFCTQSCKEGYRPEAALIQDDLGNLYGTTAEDGTACGYGCGTVFRLTLNGLFTNLHSFSGENGAGLFAALVEGSDKNFYGATQSGGTNKVGTIFRIASRGNLVTLFTFGGTDGYDPWDGLVQGTDGAFYGTAWRGGSSANCGFGCGTVFSLSVGLGPFVRTQPTSGRVGAPVKILGTNLTGTTSVTFNGTASTFTAVSSTLITTSVPAGATSGTLQVVTPSGTLSSNAPFRVRP